jgi:hypothetical protein
MEFGKDINHIDGQDIFLVKFMLVSVQNTGGACVMNHYFDPSVSGKPLPKTEIVSLFQNLQKCVMLILSGQCFLNLFVILIEKLGDTVSQI